MLISAAFFLTALIYSMIGFGGGSTYTAILALSKAPHSFIPAISLVCNVIVVSGGIWRFFRAGHINLVRALPWIFFSVPAAWLGGMVRLEEKDFLFLLGSSLLVAGLRLSLSPHISQKLDILDQQNVLNLGPLSRFAVGGVFGGSLGFLAGLTGIGGGIFLAPVLYFLRWGYPKEIAGMCSLFILVNSLSGFFGHASRLYQDGEAYILLNYWPLMLAVFAGGAIGSWIGASKLNAQHIARLTGVLILYVSANLLMRGWNLS